MLVLRIGILTSFFLECLWFLQSQPREVVLGGKVIKMFFSIPLWLWSFSPLAPMTQVSTFVIALAVPQPGDILLIPSQVHTPWLLTQRSHSPLLIPFHICAWTTTPYRRAPRIVPWFSLTAEEQRERGLSREVGLLLELRES